MSWFDFPHRNTYPRIAYTLLNLKRDSNILEVGCAEGYFSGVLAGKSGAVIGIDIDNRLLQQAKSKATNLSSRISMISASVTHLPFREHCFDRACLLEVIEHLTPKMEFRGMSEIYHVLKEKGILVLSTPNKGKVLQYLLLDGSFCIKGHRHFSPSDLGDLAGNFGFKIEKIFTSGGLVYALLFYTLFWRLRRLLRFQVFRKFMKLLIHVAEVEFYGERADGCVIFLQAKRPHTTYASGNKH